MHPFDLAAFFLKMEKLLDDNPHLRAESILFLANNIFLYDTLQVCKPLQLRDAAVLLRKAQTEPQYLEIELISKKFDVKDIVLVQQMNLAKGVSSR